MIFALIVKSSALDSQGAWSALQFAEAAISDGHNISRVFFYQSGVLNANKQNQLPQGQADPSPRWQALADKNVELCVCISSAIRRGVLDNNEAKRYKKHGTLHGAFTIGGLGQLIDASVSADRIVTFN